MSFVLVGSNIPDRTLVTSNWVHRADDGRIYLPCDVMYGGATCLNDWVTVIKYMNNSVQVENQTILLLYQMLFYARCPLFLLIESLNLIFFSLLWFNKRKLMNLIAFCQLKLYSGQYPFIWMQNYNIQFLY